MLDSGVGVASNLLLPVKSSPPFVAYVIADYGLVSAVPFYLLSAEGI